MANVLVVDDEPALLESMRAYLTRLGHFVSAFQKAETAWEHFIADPSAYSVVIVDMTLDGMPGETFIRKVLDRNPAVAVLATSGCPGSLHNFERPSGARIAMLEKPFRLSELLQLVGELAGKNATGVTP